MKRFLNRRIIFPLIFFCMQFFSIISFAQDSDTLYLNPPPPPYKEQGLFEYSPKQHHFDINPTSPHYNTFPLYKGNMRTLPNVDLFSHTCMNGNCDKYYEKE